ncbi:Multidrug and toxin extrusion protein 1 [Phytophthora cinnamomi]|uniref:Multidrug and toxin extrusion protein 1 n=1 Tax=Phytophthora cinnamomi TaxID=4785 RepID=UPI003559B26D|nr:Multidrug and toxin extrusion protein 1 [Phytophthora cinnamomi]
MDSAAPAGGPRIRVTRAFSQIEEPAALQQLQELLRPAPKKTLDVRRLVSPARGPSASAPAPPTPPPLKKQPAKSPANSSSSSAGRPGLPPRNSSAGRDDAADRRRRVSVGRAGEAAGLRRNASTGGGHDEAAAEPRRGSSEWAEAAARLSRRVEELERENFRLKTGKEPPKSFAGGEIGALRLDAEADGGDAGEQQTRRASLNKSRSCANGFGVTGLTVAEAAAASHRSRTRRLASAANATEAAAKLRSGYWNGANNVKSSFSCNNLADLEQPEFMLEKLRALPGAAPSSGTANGGDKGATAPPVAATARNKEASRKSDSFQRTSSETEEDIASMRSQRFALKARKTSSVVAQQSSSSVLDDDFEEVEKPITSPRSYFEAGLRTGSFSLPAASPGLKAGKRTSVRDVRMWVGTWNMGAADPFDDGKGIIDEQRSAPMLQNFLPHGYQLYVLGVQEGVSENVYHAVEAYLNRNERGARYYRMELKNSNFMVNHKNQPPDAVIDAVHGRGDGAFVGTKFTGMAVFYCADIQDRIKLIRAGAHKFKLTSGSKGGVAVALMINHTTIVFVNCHLDARNDTYRREQIRNLNASLGRVMGHYSFDLTEQFHHVVWMGDMNYRIVLLDPQMVLHMLEEGRNLELHDKFDGLLNDRRNGGVFEGFMEPHKFPDFYPTYKKFPKRGPVNESLPLWPSLVWRVLYKEPFYKGGKVKKRVPGWCDRILIHSLLVSDSKLIPEKVLDPTSQEQASRYIDNYRSVNHGVGMDVSDHSPVYGTFVLSFLQHDSDVLSTASPRRLSRRNSRSYSTASGKSEGDRYSNAAAGSYFDQARVVRQMKAQNRPVSTVLRVFNMQLIWNDTNVVVPKKTRIVAPLVGEDSKQCDVIGERCQGSNGLNLSLNAVIQHTRPLEQLHMLVWVKNESINGHCTLSLKRIARQEEEGEVRFRVPLYNDSMRVHLDGHPLLVVFSVRSKTFAK